MSVDLLELAGFAGAKRALADRMAVLRYQLDIWQSYYYTGDASLKKELASPERWDYGPYDSD